MNSYVGMTIVKKKNLQGQDDHFSHYQPTYVSATDYQRT